MNRAFTAKDKRAASREVTETETRIPEGIKTYLSHSRSQSGGIPSTELFPAEMQIKQRSTSGIPTHTSFLHRRDKPPKQQALKSNANYIRENYKTVENGKSVLKGLVCGFT